MKYLLIIFGLQILSLPTYAQFKYRIDEILDERDSLMEMNSYLNETNSGFFGNKTKKDLRNIISTLEEIIRKDTELVMAIRSMNIQKEYRLTDKNLAFEERIQDLENESRRYQRMYAQLQQKYSEITQDEELNNSTKHGYQKFILFLVLSNLLFIYLWRRKK